MNESWHNQFMSIPFVERGRTRQGADCWGLVCIIYKEILNIELPLLDDYANTLDRKTLPHIIEKESLRSWVKVEQGEEQAYDVAIFRTGGVPMHIGVVVRPGFMIHSQSGNDTLFSNYVKEKEWSKRLVGFCRYVGK